MNIVNEPLDLELVSTQVETVLRELVQAGGLAPGQWLVVGASTSEVAGERIGTAGSEAIAEAIYRGIERVRAECGFVTAFQCCEHLNRALVVEREQSERAGLTEVSAIPIPKAGGSMAACAYRRMRDPVLAESVRAHAGLDIGETLIGMHLRPVAVPFRPSVRWIGRGRVTMAYTRPKLIGGARAVYTPEAARAATGTAASPTAASAKPADGRDDSTTCS